MRCRSRTCRQRTRFPTGWSPSASLAAHLHRRLWRQSFRWRRGPRSLMLLLPLTVRPARHPRPSYYSVTVLASVIVSIDLPLLIVCKMGPSSLFDRLTFALPVETMPVIFVASLKSREHFCRGVLWDVVLDPRAVVRAPPDLVAVLPADLAVPHLEGVDQAHAAAGSDREGTVAEPVGRQRDLEDAVVEHPFLGGEPVQVGNPMDLH